MCILMHFKPGYAPIGDHLKEGCESNPDGFGWAIVTGQDDDAFILTGHGMNPDSVMDEFMEARSLYMDGPALFHARITTHGGTDIDNCHPFNIGGREDMVLAHNGMVPSQPITGDRRSDTRILAEDVMLARFRHLDSRKTKRRFEEWISSGYTSKVLILTTGRSAGYQQQAYLFNEGAGVWHNEGIWYSNTSYKPGSWGRYSVRSLSCWYCGEYACMQTCPASEEFESHLSNEPRYARSDSRSYRPYVALCTTCDLAPCYCRCIGELSVRFVAVPDNVEGTDPATWECESCWTVGAIGLITGECRICGAMVCCGERMKDCKCFVKRD